MRKRSRADIVHETLRHLIVTLQLEPGQPLLERELCERFQVSRTPLREAIL
ncbi:MAG: GntR family transcriptional regulator, partial [Pannonibacter indicus]